MTDLGKGIGEIIGAFIGGFVMVIIFVGCIAWGGWRVLKLLSRPERQCADFVLPVVLILLGIMGILWSP